MPPRNQSDGFSDRNQHLGSYWKNLGSDEKDIYNNDVFYLLGYLASGWELPSQESGEMQLSEEEIAEYLPIFKKNVNLDKVARDLGKGKFGPDLATANQNKGIQAIEQIDNDVCQFSIPIPTTYY